MLTLFFLRTAHNINTLCVKYVDLTNTKHVLTNSNDWDLKGFLTSTNYDASKAVSASYRVSVNVRATTPRTTSKISDFRSVNILYFTTLRVIQF